MTTPEKRDSRSFHAYVWSTAAGVGYGLHLLAQPMITGTVRYRETLDMALERFGAGEIIAALAVATGTRVAFALIEHYRRP